MRRCKLKTAKVLSKHFDNRALDRFGLSLTFQEIRDISNIIKNQKKFKVICTLESQSNSRTKKVVLFKNKVLPVIYDKIRHTVVTVLSYDMLNDKEKEIILTQLNKINAEIDAEKKEYEHQYMLLQCRLHDANYSYLVKKVKIQMEELRNQFSYLNSISKVDINDVRSEFNIS